MNKYTNEMIDTNEMIVTFEKHFSQWQHLKSTMKSNVKTRKGNKLI